MSDNKKMHDTENKDEWINWIEEAIDKEHIKYYEYEEFSNFQEIGSGSFGKVYRANWKNSGKCFALKSFFKHNNITLKEIVRELKNQREVDYHDNIIRCHGITKFVSTESQTSHLQNYWLVMEYANSGNLRCYLEKNFNKLTWKDKYNMAYQLACAVSCLHNEEIIHCDLHSCNILVHQNTIKLADFGLSKRIGAGKPPFYGEKYDIGLVLEISRGRRETVVLDTPENYKTIYTKCWDGEPDNRPTIHQVVDWLNKLITKTDVIITEQEINETSININIPELQGELSQLLENFDKIDTKEIDSIVISSGQKNISSDKQEFNEASSISTNKSELQGELSQLIENFDKINTKEIDSIEILSEQGNISIEKDINIIVDEINDLISTLLNKGFLGHLVKQQVIDYFNDHNMNSQEIYNWLLDNQISANSIFLFGYFNYYEIGTSIDYKKAFNLFINASKQDHILAQFFVGDCYLYGYGTTKNKKLAFEYYEKVANKNISYGQNSMGYCYKNRIGVKKDPKKAFCWYEKAANNGNIMAIYNLGYCYYDGIGTKTNKQKAFVLYQEAAELGVFLAQNNLALMYKKGDGVTKDINKAMYWFQKSAEQGYDLAKTNLKDLQKKIDSL
ncbi:kinase-like domain-containing protein [Rhizophagus clarus]|uniref:Kinase-like domain-containing protein n=1 Tax=Rhizophagus clarus TaxID=94130 RepID=A0A8H3R9K3_9GLOM|nr:kinase-like domain-containing protein [Rhizophagus clarus]